MTMQSFIDVKRALRIGVAIGAGAAAATAAAAADPFAGVSVNTSASHVTIVCSTCGTPRTFDDVAARGGTGATSALYANGAVGWGVGASAQFDFNGLPALGVFTFAEVIPLQVGGDLYDTFATAKGLQRFDYLGSTSTTYAFSFAIEGTFTLGTADATSPMAISGGFTAFGSDFNPQGETHGTVLGSDVVGAHASVAGVSPFSLPGGFSFDVAPGDSFYMQAQLTATAITNIAHQANGTVDALHTMSGRFTGGDTTLLRAAISPVPEVPTLPMLAVGLLVMSLRLRRSPARVERHAQRLLTGPR